MHRRRAPRTALKPEHQGRVAFVPMLWRAAAMPRHPSNSSPRGKHLDGFSDETGVSISDTISKHSIVVHPSFTNRPWDCRRARSTDQAHPRRERPCSSKRRSTPAFSWHSAAGCSPRHRTSARRMHLSNVSRSRGHRSSGWTPRRRCRCRRSRVNRSPRWVSPTPNNCSPRYRPTPALAAPPRPRAWARKPTVSPPPACGASVRSAPSSSSTADAWRTTRRTAPPSTSIPSRCRPSTAWRFSRTAHPASTARTRWRG